jgi:heme/copper-type cytochrome/quinol oxidase subunit 1
MKFKSETFFLITAFFLFLFSFKAEDKNLEIQNHDTYFIISCLELSVLFSILMGLTAVIYFVLEKLDRPIKSKTGFWHFGLFILGVLLIITTIKLPRPTSYYNIDGYSFSSYFYILAAMALMGLILLAASLIVFVYGVIKAIFNRR